MKRVFLGVFLILFLLLFGHFPSVFAQTPTPAGRFAVCDLCGYCQGNPPPSSWNKCAECLYGVINGDPTSNATLKIDPATNLPQKALPGKMYTQLGCIGTNLGGFQQQGAAAGVVQILLNVIFSIVGGLAFLSLIYGSFIILTSQADPERLNYGKRVVYGAIIGVIFTFSAVFLVNLLASGILKIPGFSSGASP